MTLHLSHAWTVTPPAPAVQPAPTRPGPMGGRIEANAGGSVFILPGATVAQLRWLRAHIDAAIAERGAEA